MYDSRKTFLQKQFILIMHELPLLVPFQWYIPSSFQTRPSQHHHRRDQLHCPSQYHSRHAWTASRSKAIYGQGRLLYGPMRPHGNMHQPETELVGSRTRMYATYIHDAPTPELTTPRKNNDQQQHDKTQDSLTILAFSTTSAQSNRAA